MFEMIPTLTILMVRRISMRKFIINVFIYSALFYVIHTLNPNFGWGCWQYWATVGLMAALGVNLLID